jgi:prefoldin alpha subunit
MFAKVADPSKVILNIGAGLAKEEKISDAVDKLTSRIDNIENNKKKIQDTIENLQDQAAKLSASIEERYKEYSEDLAPEGNSGSPNVS